DEPSQRRHTRAAPPAARPDRRCIRGGEHGVPCTAVGRRRPLVPAHLRCRAAGADRQRRLLHRRSPGVGPGRQPLRRRWRAAGHQPAGVPRRRRLPRAGPLGPGPADGARDGARRLAALPPDVAPDGPRRARAGGLRPTPGL
ncbi:MAG: hypothetical protein AVDCRST_MAG57-481, partial [uncultured Blastococcus sp.]